jgi:organic hydroperoxide reductase OsmC/OhrA
VDNHEANGTNHNDLLLADDNEEHTMKIAARVSNAISGHAAEVETDGRKQSIAVAPKNTGRGSSLNGGELLFAALVICFCNNLYREAGKREVEVQSVNVEVTGTFGNPGEPARDISYRVLVHADATRAEIDDLIRATDSVTEIQKHAACWLCCSVGACVSSVAENPVIVPERELS